ncbi:lantibiotic dehydratase, partial [Frankia sp. Cj3]|uniref:lantibiotic dehydratase n=1 Tax=Frankia sp. Cj3 TaxID=2880976 RepID=UPI001EF4177F
VCAVVEQPLAVDLRLGCEAVLPGIVAAEAATAAEALRRLTPYPAGHPSWQDYHRRFLDKFGVSALVRVGQLVDPVVGLGYPTHFDLVEPVSAGGVSPRDEWLLQLVQRAALNGQEEVILDDAALDALSAQTAGFWPEPHAEMCVEVLASSVAALSQGTFTLVVTGVSRTGAAMS